MREIRNLLIFFLIGLIINGCAPKKEVEQVTPISSMELPKQDISKEQILKEVQLNIEKKEYEKAISGLNKAIELDPKDASLYYTLGDLYEQLGRDKESVEAFVKALQLDKEQNKGMKGQEKSGNR